MGRLFEDIYFSKNNLIYYKYSDHHYNVPCYIDGTDEDVEAFNEEKTKISTDEYFIHDNSLIGINKIRENNYEEIDENLNTEIISRIKSIIEYS